MDRAASSVDSSASPVSGIVETDAVVIGAGPVGLFQVFQLGLQGIRCHVVDSLPRPGGQPVELYPDKPIYDIPGIPFCTGQQLVDSLLEQIAPFEADFHFNEQIAKLAVQADGRFLLEGSHGTKLLARVVVIAAGVGAFEPRKLKLAGIDAFDGNQLFHEVRDASAFAGKHLVINGANDSALEWANAFAAEGPHRAASVTLVHRRDVFQANSNAIDAMRAHVAAGRIELVIGQPGGFAQDAGRLTSLDVVLTDGSTRSIAADAVIALLGVSPKLGPVADWGLALERKQLAVDTEKFSTSVRGIFAVGDINTYPGKKKLILSGFHECALAAFGAAAIVFPGEPLHLQYTTTSPKLHALLGVTVPPSAD